jgi:hypothetical protein
VVAPLSDMAMSQQLRQVCALQAEAGALVSTESALATATSQLAQAQQQVAPWSVLFAHTLGLWVPVLWCLQRVMKGLQHHDASTQ